MSGVYQGTFKSRADEALHNPSLQKALKNFKPLFVAKRADAVAALEGFEQLRETAAAIKDAVLDNLDEWLERYASAVEAAGGHTVKVILENHYLQPQEIVEACHLAEQGGADFVKTSTGFAGSGAKVEDVALMRASVSPHIKVKAAGGVGSLEDARKMAEAGADRFGASRTEQILAGQTTASGY